MFRKSSFLKTRFLAIALSATAIASMAAQPARAAEVGARVYTQLWAPEAAARDQVQTSYDNASVVSDAVKTAWDGSKIAARIGIFTALNGRRVAPGMTLAGGATDLNEVTDISLLPAGPTLQFRVPNTVVHISVGVKALGDADDYTAGLASAVLSPQIDVSFDMLLNLSLNVSGNAVTATGVHAIVQNPTVTPKNDVAKALKGINDLVAYFGGPDFVKVLEDQFNNTNLGSQSLLDSINQGMTPINKAEQAVTASTGFTLTTLWGDNNRLTFYYAPLPRTNIPTDGQMTGNVRWDPNQFPTANCSSFRVFTDVQTGPRPLLMSDGQHYGVAPTKRIGQFSAHPAGGQALSGGISSCDYTVSAIARNWFHSTSASSLAAPANSSGGSNAQFGNLHSAGYMLPVGWPGTSVIPDPIAANKDYEMLRGMSGTSALGNPRQVMPGEKEEHVSVYGVDPAVRILQQQGQMPGAPAAPIFVHQPPTSTATNAQPQAPTNPQAPQGHATAPGQAPNGDRPDRTKIWQTGKGAETVTPGEKSSINPQPLPPRILQEQAAAGGGGMLRPGSRVMINPQPLPPRVQNGTNGIR
jgi:hypothetical protein